jgi:hypothetical protein
MTATGRRSHITAGNHNRKHKMYKSNKKGDVLRDGRRDAKDRKRYARYQRQSERRGNEEEMARRDDAAAAYRAEFVYKPPEINQLECEIGQYGCANAPCLLHFGMYVDALKEREPVLLEYYTKLHHRKLRWKTHVETQRFESKFIEDIKRTFDPDKTGKTIVIAWGAWGKVAGRPGTVGNKGRAPTIGVGLAKRIAKEDGIVVAWTPEHYTTKTHFNCGGECDRFTAAEKRRANDHLFYKAKEIRGLKICNNPECRAPVNRDLNAAKNIAANGLLLLSGNLPIRQHLEDELEILQLENEMHGAS